MSIAAATYPCRASVASSQALGVVCETAICLAANVKHCRHHKGSQSASGGFFLTGRAARLRLIFHINDMPVGTLLRWACDSHICFFRLRTLGLSSPASLYPAPPASTCLISACPSPVFPIPIFPTASSPNPFCWHRPIAPARNLHFPFWGGPHL